MILLIFKPGQLKKRRQNFLPVSILTEINLKGSGVLPDDKKNTCQYHYTATGQRSFHFA